MTATTERWIEGDGVRIFVVEGGEGRPVVLLHGGLANHLACWRFAEPLVRRFRVITPDLRGSGRSIHPGPLSWDDLAGDVARLVRSLGIAPAVIGGVSFGAGCAVRVALRHPDVVSTLVVLSPAYGGAELGLTPAQEAAMRAMDAAGRRAIAEGVGVLHPLFDALPPAIRDRARTMVDGFDAASVAATTAFLASSAQPFERGADLGAITSPVLLVPGTDPQHPVEVSDVFRANLPRCSVKNVGPEAYAAAIAAFVGDELGEG